MKGEKGKWDICCVIPTGDILFTPLTLHVKRLLLLLKYKESDCGGGKECAIEF